MIADKGMHSKVWHTEQKKFIKHGSTKCVASGQASTAAQFVKAAFALRFKDIIESRQ